MTTYKVAILGQDTYENVSKVKKHLYNWRENFGDSLEIVSGGGKYGVEKSLGNFKNELIRDMKLLGCKKISDLSRDNIRFRHD